MFKSLFPLAVQGVLRKRRASLLTVLVLLLTFSCAITSLSLTESLNKTNEALRLNAFGGWYLAIPDGKEEDAAFLAQQDWAEAVAHSRIYCEIDSGSTMHCLGTLDDSFVQLSRIQLLAGRMPQQDGEIVLTEEVLDEYGYTADMVGQEIKLSIKLNCAEQEDSLVAQGSEKTTKFTLCGVISSYSFSWVFAYNKQGRGTVNGIVTEETAQRLYREFSGYVRKGYSAEPQSPVDQYYISVAAENRAAAIKACGDYMHTNRDAVREDCVPCVNRLSFPDEEAVASSRDLYAFLIAAVALVAVLCVYLMQLPAEVHSFAVLRSIGITKGQLLLLMLFEALLLVVPAVLLGIPLGAGLTWLVLRLLVYSGGAAIQVSIPYGVLKFLLALWLGVIVLARLVIFFVTVRTPLTGRMQMQQEKARSSRHFRYALIILLLVALTTTTVYTYSAAAKKQQVITMYGNAPGYSISNSRDSGGNYSNTALVSQETRDYIAVLPGVEQVEGYFQLLSGNSPSEGLASVRISFDGIEEQTVDFAAIEYEGWAESFDLSTAEARAFENGDIVLLCIPWDDESTILPQGDILLCAVNGQGEIVSALSATPLVWQVPRNFLHRGQGSIGTSSSYTVVCSETYFKKLLSAMQPGTEWAGYEAGGTYGYSLLLVTTSDSVDELSTTAAVKTYCTKKKLTFFNYWEKVKDSVETATQELILLYACGGCVALVSLLLLASALALEAEQERRSYTILRVIGMSARQMRRRVFGKALWRSVFAIVAGWALYVVLCIRTQLALNELTFAEAAERAWSSFTYYGGGLPFIAVLSAAMLAVLLAVSLLAKRGLKQTTLLK